MPIPEKIILDIWEFIVQNYGMTCGIVCIFFALQELIGQAPVTAPLPTYGKPLEPFA